MKEGSLDPEKIVLPPSQFDHADPGEGKPFWGERYWFGELMLNLNWKTEFSVVF